MTELGEPVMTLACVGCGVVVGRFHEAWEGVIVLGDDCPHGGRLGGRPAADLYNALLSDDPRELEDACARYDVAIAVREASS